MPSRKVRLFSGGRYGFDTKFGLDADDTFACTLLGGALPTALEVLPRVSVLGLRAAVTTVQDFLSKVVTTTDGKLWDCRWLLGQDNCTVAELLKLNLLNYTGGCCAERNKAELVDATGLPSRASGASCCALESIVL